MSSTVAIIGGGGNVGSSIAFTLIIKQLTHEILIVDVNEEAAEGQALDLRDAAYLSRTKCRKGTSQEAGQADVIVISAGARQKAGEKRTELFERNYKIINSIMESMKPIKPDAKILVVSNPADVLTHIAQATSGHARHLVMGAGTFLDSGRLRLRLSEITGINPTSIHAYALGVHGDEQFIAWSNATIGGMPLLSHSAMKGKDLGQIQKDVTETAYAIIEAKGSTYYGVASHVAFIVNALLQNTEQVVPVTHYNKEFGCFLSWPAVIGIDGVK
ncbi:hypothetical protein EV182_001444, partial [Spiromyces aspiralis]